MKKTTRQAALSNEALAANDNTAAPPVARVSKAIPPALAADNDNAAADRPTPPPVSSVVRVPLVWDRRDPHVATLTADLSARRAQERHIPTLKVLDAFDRIAADDGLVPGINGRPSLRAFGKLARMDERLLAKGRPAREAYDLYVDRFLVSERSVFCGSLYAGGRPATLKDDIAAYVQGCAADGEAFPSTNKGKISLAGVAHRLNRNVNKLRSNPDACAPMHAALKEGRVRLGPVYEPARTMSIEEEDARVAELIAAADSFDVPGAKVPRRLGTHATPDFERVAALTGRVEPTGEGMARVERHLRAISRRRGMFLPGEELGGGTIAALRLQGVEWVVADQSAKGTATSGAAVANHTSAFDRLVEVARLTGEDQATDLFGNRFDEVLARLLANFSNERSAANVRRYALAWRDFHLAAVGAAGLPEAFGPAIDVVMTRRGMMLPDLAQAAELPAATLQKWVLGQSAPSVENLAAVRRIELSLGLPPNALAVKLGRLVRRVDHVRDATSWWRAVPHRVRALLPAEAATWTRERLDDAVAKVAPLVSKSTGFGQRIELAHRPENMLPPFAPNARLEADIDAFVAYKRAPVVISLQRSSGGRWLSPQSGTIHMRQVREFYRFASAPLGEGPAAGLGVDAGLATLAWLAHPVLALAFVGHRGARFRGFVIGASTRGISYGNAEKQFLMLLASMTNPVTGFLAQQPGFADQLVPIEMAVPSAVDDLLRHFEGLGGGVLLGEDDIAFARRDWPGFVARAHRAFLQAITYLEDVVEVQRNPMTSIAGLIEADEPMCEWLSLCFDAEGRWASESTSPQHHRLDVRDSLMARLAPITGFRPENLYGLVYTGDQRGEIRKVDGTWQIEVDYRKFKNFRSCRLFGPKTARQNFRMDLDDVAGLYDVLDRYFFHCRPGLLREANTAAFINRRGAPMKLSDYYCALHVFGEHNVAWNPVKETGFPGVTSINPYAMRHLRASDVLKNGTSANRVEEAAFAIQTSEAMIGSHYGFLIPKTALRDGHATFAKAARKAWNRRRR